MAHYLVQTWHQKWPRSIGPKTTVAYQLPKDYQGDGKDVDHKILKLLFHRPYFHVNVIDDVAGISIAGALKNVVALACGFVEGMGWGNNASAAIQRLGLGEIIKFGRMFSQNPKSRPTIKNPLVLQI